MTGLQRKALQDLCSRYGVDFESCRFASGFDLPEGWLHGWVGPIYVGVSPEGEVHS